MKLPPMPSVAAIDVSGERVGDCPESKPNLTMNFEQSMLEIAATIALNVVFDRHHSFSTLQRSKTYLLILPACQASFAQDFYLKHSLKIAAL